MTTTTLNHDLTPKMTQHALDRCAEMGIPAKVAKAIYRTPNIVWVCRARPQQRPGTTRYHVTSAHWPYGVVVEVRDGEPESVVVLTVLEWHGGGRTEYVERQN